MTRAVCKADDRRPNSLWDTSSLRARCVELDGDPTLVIPTPLLRRLIAETTEEGALAESGVMAAAAPRFEIVEIGPDDIAGAEDGDEVVIDDSAFEVAFEEMRRDEP